MDCLQLLNILWFIWKTFHDAILVQRMREITVCLKTNSCAANFDVRQLEYGSCLQPVVSDTSFVYLWSSGVQPTWFAA